MIRSFSSFWVGVALSTLMASSLLGCAGGGPKAPTAAELAGREARVIVVAPLNVASSLPVEIEDASKIVTTTLVSYLEEHGKTVKKLGFRVGRGLWVKAAQQVIQAKKKRSFENAVSFYAREIRKQVDYDVLIVPTLYVQNARVRSRFVRWDDAKEVIRVEGKRVLSRKDQSFDSLSANVKAASLMATVFTSDGVEIQSGKRGLQVLEHVEISEGTGLTRDRGRFQLVMNVPPLDDARKIRAGIAAALVPFLAELPEVEDEETTGESEGSDPE